MSSDSELHRHIEAFNVAHGLQEGAHQTVWSYLHFEPPRSAVEAARRSRGWAEMTCKPVLAISDYEAAIQDMIDRDLLWKIDGAKQALIADYLASAPALGPMDGMPEIGTLQFSVRFAHLLDELWAGIDCERPGVIWSRDWQSDKLNLVYSPKREGCLEFLREQLADAADDTIKIERVSGPRLCGPWRCAWWRKYDSGYVLEVHYV